MATAPMSQGRSAAGCVVPGSTCSATPTFSCRCRSIGRKESNIILRVINIYNTLFLLFALFIVATSRAAMLAFLVVIFIYLIAKKIHKFIFPFIALLILGGQAFTLFYVRAKGTAIGTTLNTLTEKYTGKRFFSGRDRVWKESLDEVLQSGNIWTGLGNNTQHGEPMVIYIMLMFNSFTNLVS